MAPCRGVLLNLVIAITIAPLKLIAPIIQWNFRRIIRNCAIAEWQERSDNSKAKKMEESLKNTGSVRPKHKVSEERVYDSDEL